MRVNGIQCHTCTKLYNGGRTEFCGDIPKGWSYLFVQGDDAPHEGEHFCSLKCLREWVEKCSIVSEPVEVSNPAYEEDRRATPEYWRDL
jgi:hypothetical protein